MDSEAYSILGHKHFRFYMGSRFSLTLALQIQSVAVAWQIYSLTKDPLSLGLVGLAEVIPAIAFALFAGHIVDRSDRRSIVLFGLAVGLLSGLSLTTLSLD